MLLKPGVDIWHLKRPLRRALYRIDMQWVDFVLTETRHGSHRPDSLHYADLAVDIRKTSFQGKKIDLDLLRSILGAGFQVVDEKDHFHIEYDTEE